MHEQHRHVAIRFDISDDRSVDTSEHFSNIQVMVWLPSTVRLSSCD